MSPAGSSWSGSGGREHALCWRLASGRRCERGARRARQPGHDRCRPGRARERHRRPTAIAGAASGEHASTSWSSARRRRSWPASRTGCAGAGIACSGRRRGRGTAGGQQGVLPRGRGGGRRAHGPRARVRRSQSRRSPSRRSWAAASRSRRTAWRPARASPSATTSRPAEARHPRRADRGRLRRRRADASSWRSC